MHPVCLGISFVCSVAYSVMLKGIKQLKTNLKLMLPVVLFTALINALFNHRGATILIYLPSGNPLTFEAIIYGVCASIMIASVLCHFICYNEVMTSDKFIYLFGKIMPSLSLIISMTFRFVPHFANEFKSVINAQKCMGKDIAKGNFRLRLKNTLNVLSIMTTKAFENSIDTADSMKARGYGLSKRTSFSTFKFSKRDFVSLIYLLVVTAYIFVGSINGKMSFTFYPSISKLIYNTYTITVFIAYLMLCMFPILIEIREVIKWKYLRSKI